MFPDIKDIVVYLGVVEDICECLDCILAELCILAQLFYVEVRYDIRAKCRVII